MLTPTRVAFALLAMLAPMRAEARSKPLAVAEGAPASHGAPWSPRQAIGAADVPQAGDDVRAWATMQANAGPEWLEVDFPEARVIKEVHIYESLNPGAVVRVEAMSEEGPRAIWEGVEKFSRWCTSPCSEIHSDQSPGRQRPKPG